MRAPFLLFVLPALTTSIFGCKDSTSLPPPQDAGDLSACEGTVAIGADFPMSGSQGEAASYVENGVRLAIEQTQSSHMLGGCNIDYSVKDDASPTTKAPDKATGKANMDAFIAVPNLVAVIGPYNSGVAVAEIPETNRAGVLQLSPATSNPGLTVAGTDPTIDTASLRPSGKVTFFRVAVNDKLQGKLAAQVAYETMRARKVYDLDDASSYGADLSNHFDAFFKQRGGTVLRAKMPNPPPANFDAQIAQAKDFKADVIFFGGIAESGAGAVRAQFQKAGFAGFLTVDGSLTPRFLTDAASAAEGTMATGEADVLSREPGITFAAQYRERFKQEAQEYSPFGYEAARIVLTAIHDAIAENGGKLPAPIETFRAQVIQRVAGIRYTGILGANGFDANGDTTNTHFGIYKVVGGKWKQQQEVSVDSAN